LKVAARQDNFLKFKKFYKKDSH